MLKSLITYISDFTLVIFHRRHAAEHLLVSYIDKEPYMITAKAKTNEMKQSFPNIDIVPRYHPIHDISLIYIFPYLQVYS